jgi:hypothetical protein
LMAAPKPSDRRAWALYISTWLGWAFCIVRSCV